MLNSALSVIHEEHRSLAAVVQGLRYIASESVVNNTLPDFGVLRAMVFYLDEFPEKLHHPKEDSYLFARLRERTHEADSVIDVLEQHHAEGGQRVRDLEKALDRFEGGAVDGRKEFSEAVAVFAEAMLDHIASEEQTLIPLARKHLSPADWVEIGAAFGENGDPRFDAAADLECRDLFSRILRLAPPPNGTGPIRA
jgi:hemerythrin-like domain-containing protein